jgi:hypothetical protein
MNEPTRSEMGELAEHFRAEAKRREIIAQVRTILAGNDGSRDPVALWLRACLEEIDEQTRTLADQAAVLNHYCQLVRNYEALTSLWARSIPSQHIPGPAYEQIHQALDDIRVLEHSDLFEKIPGE